jgi:hypothetical protein
MGHVVLLGDSIFDNASYVPGKPPVIEQTRRTLPVGWNATLLAVDGNVTADVPGQLKRLPADITHLFVSAGGNDALGASGVLGEPACTVGDAMNVLDGVLAEFRDDYRRMLDTVLQAGKPTCVCTIYDSIPDLGRAEQAALTHFNDVILREAIRVGVLVIDLRQVCNQRDDYSSVSRIEPSVGGGAKIAAAIVAVTTGHDFASGRCAIYR